MKILAHLEKRSPGIPRREPGALIAKLGSGYDQGTDMARNLAYYLPDCNPSNPRFPRLAVPDPKTAKSLGSTLPLTDYAERTSDPPSTSLRWLGKTGVSPQLGIKPRGRLAHERAAWLYETEYATPKLVPLEIREGRVAESGFPHSISYNDSKLPYLE